VIFRCTLLWACACAASLQVNASVLLDRSRVVLSAGETEATVRVRNEEDGPVLVQAWINDLDGDALPEQASSPFLVTPPLRRLDPDQSLSLRIRLLAMSTLPGDRESMYWLNVVDLPGEVAHAPQDPTVSIIVRSRIKLIYRPAALAAPLPKDAKALRWRLAEHAGEAVVVITNPGPNYLNVSRAVADTAGTSTLLAIGAVRPLADTVVAADSVDFANVRALRFQWLDDSGMAHEELAALGH